MGTKFATVYNRFLGKITDDMYIELTPQDTMRDLRNLLIEAIPNFEFPRKNLDSYILSTLNIAKDQYEDSQFIVNEIDDLHYEIENSSFAEELTTEEINILALIMKAQWVQRQVASIENTRMKYSGSDFKMTSQANHLSKLQSLATETLRESFHMQRLYKRRKLNDNGMYQSNWSILRETSALD